MTERRIVPKPDIRAIVADAFEARAEPAVAVPEVVGCAGDEGKCRSRPTELLGTVALCTWHRREVLKAAETCKPQPPPDEGFQTVARAVVYYMGDPDRGEVKIGTTTRLRGRFMSLATLRRKVVLLATEPGGTALESQRHSEFRALRMSGEWFRKESSLMQHIGRLRAEHGILLTGDGELPSWGVAPVQARLPISTGAVAPPSGDEINK